MHPFAIVFCQKGPVTQKAFSGVGATVCVCVCVCVTDRLLPRMIRWYLKTHTTSKHTMCQYPWWSVNLFVLRTVSHDMSHPPQDDARDVGCNQELTTLCYQESSVFLTPPRSERRCLAPINTTCWLLENNSLFGFLVWQIVLSSLTHAHAYYHVTSHALLQ